MALSSPHKLVSLILRIVLLTLVYLASGWLSLLLAIPPGFVSGIFLPLGISLAALLIWGNPLVIGVLLGSTLLNIGVALADGQTLTSGVVGVGFFIACGSSIACLVGAWLIRRFVGFPNHLTDERDIFLVFILGGPIAAAISASIGTLVLFAYDIISINQIIFSWGTWWIGDAIGVLIAVPLMCVFFAEPRYFWRNRRATVGIPLVVSSLVVVIIFITASNNEQKKWRCNFGRRRV
jgi:integral membrane sensor domain MASE1